MQFRNVTVEQAKLAAAQVPCRLQDVQAHKGYFTAVIRATVGTDPSLKTSNRSAGAMSYEGHRAFFDALYRICPDADITFSSRIVNGGRYAGIESYLVQVPTSSIKLSEVR